jgi:hypothetical protein
MAGHRGLEKTCPSPQAVGICFRVVIRRRGRVKCASVTLTVRCQHPDHALAQTLISADFPRLFHLRTGLALALVPLESCPSCLAAFSG